ncbi:MAG: YidC/Oxa1 family membrane protein insertase [Patescibacteria group bacterium]
MSNLFHEILYRPLFNALIFLYQNFSFGDFGIAIILLTIAIRFILFPFFYKSAKDQAILQRLAPKIKAIQAEHKNDREKQAREMLALYRQHEVNPLSGFFFIILVQLPILIALYQVFLKGFSVESLTALYSFIEKPESINVLFLGIIDLTKTSLFMAALAAIAQYFQGKLSLPKIDPKDVKNLTPIERTGRQMVYIGPVLTIVFLYFFKLSSAIAIFWLTTSIFSVIQQVIINKRLKDNGTPGA